MVSPQGFNALLKIVEEPPEHVRFIFATTEPEKVIGTIRSRTHHYPFRLIPPQVLSAYLARALRAGGRHRSSRPRCRSSCAPAAARRGTRSRCSTSSSAGPGGDGVTYALAAGAARLHPRHACSTRSSTRSPPTTAPRSSASSTRSSRPARTRAGSPRTCCSRLRDLVIIAAVPDAPATGLIDVPEDQAERLVAQAARFGRARAVPGGRPRRRGAHRAQGRPPRRGCCSSCSAPGSCCPAPTTRAEGLAARIDRLEKRMSIGAAPPSGRAPGRPARRGAGPRPPEPAPASTPAPAAPSRPRRPSRAPGSRRWLRRSAGRPSRPQPAQPAPQPRRAEPAAAAEPAAGPSAEA